MTVDPIGRMTVDPIALLTEMALTRPVFHSEADLQHALAWQLHADMGLALVLTNDPAYWQPGRAVETIDARFRIDEARTLVGSLAWGARAGDGTTRGREAALTLIGRYRCTWRDYSTVPDDDRREHRWRYLALTVPNGETAGTDAADSTLGASPEEPANDAHPVASARQAVLTAARLLADRSPDGTFSPAEVVAECRRAGCGYADRTIRTHVTSRMCVDAPPHHARRYPDLERAAGGRYRLRTGHG